MKIEPLQHARLHDAHATSSQCQHNGSKEKIHCFVYGALSNPISRARRGVQTRSAQPATLQEYQISFGQGGAASLVPKRGWTVHGVLLECATKHDLELLKEIGAKFDRVQLPVVPYNKDDDEAILASVYVMSKKQEESYELPQERYVRIIGEGLKYHGVDQEYIDYQIMNANYTPNPKELLKFQDTKKQHKLLYSTYLSKSSRHMWFLVGRRVIEIQVPKKTDDPFVMWAKRELVGKADSTWFMLQSMYEPSLPVCTSDDNVTPVHVEWAEHQLVEKFQESNVPAVAIGIVEEETTSNRRRSLFDSLSRKAFSFRNLKF